MLILGLGTSEKTNPYVICWLVVVVVVEASGPKTALHSHWTSPNKFVVDDAVDYGAHERVARMVVYLGAIAAHNVIFWVHFGKATGVAL